MTASAEASTNSSYRSSSPERDVKYRYFSPEFLALENERLWTKVWQLACREEELWSVGDYVVYTIADQSILLVRGSDNLVKGYHNACLHRGMRLKEGVGHIDEIRCPSHAWAWNLDGSLKEVTDPFDFDPATVDVARLGLREVRVDSWAGFVFVNMDVDAVPLRSFLGEVVARVERFGLDRMTCVKHRTTVLEANWKLAHEAFVETYHAVGTHPQTLRYLDDTDMNYEQHGVHGMHRVKPGGLGTPSPRLGDYDPDRREILLAMVGDLAEMDYYKQEEVDQVNVMVDAAMAMPDVPIGAFFANVRREQAKAEGMDFSEFSDHDILAGELWNVFPNFTAPCNAGNGNIIRFRPNGGDPESCIMDIYYLQRFAGDERRPMPEPEQYANWRDAEGWGAVLRQDFTNLPIWQRGVHSLGFEGPIWGRQDGNVSNFHRALTSYVEA
jgi:phenylpropionate dioxygenase-like ring-hydroxylating dioxygenase large terminal subunit